MSNQDIENTSFSLMFPGGNKEPPIANHQLSTLVLIPCRIRDLFQKPGIFIIPIPAGQ